MLQPGRRSGERSQRSGASSSTIGSLNLPKGYIAGAVGAGDAFCAGMLYGLHEGGDAVADARLGNCCAAASLSRPGASEGIMPLLRGNSVHLSVPPCSIASIRIRFQPRQGA
ncbi:MAG: carbohydrate kinase family protein [Kiritimatiellae bacterium]|nr:carbohydrate kinase family protein [Kiritimatiellia bacterium]